MTVHDRVATARTRLRAAGLGQAEAELGARLLAQFVLGWDAARFATFADREEPSGFHDDYQALVSKRIAREPLAYITGTREFWGLEFAVSPAVLIPRPETELIVETMLKRHPDLDQRLDVADVGTGSGCLAIALARERPQWRIAAVDISDDALRIARENATRLGVADRVEFAQSDLLNAVNRRVDAIVSNPPYVKERDRPGLQPEVRDYEPSVALFGGGDGLSLIRELIAQSVTRLKPGGALIFEFGCGQDDDVMQLIAAHPELEPLEPVSDLQGIARVAVALRR